MALTLPDPRCDALYAHRERPLDGRCTSAATKRAPSDGRALDDGPWIYSCDAHAAANPWEAWEAWELLVPEVDRASLVVGERERLDAVLARLSQDRAREAGGMLATTEPPGCLAGEGEPREAPPALRARVARLRAALVASDKMPGGIMLAIAVGNTRRELGAAEAELAARERDGAT